MRILKSWQSRLRERSLQKKVLQSNCQRNPVAFNAAKSVGVLFDATDQFQRDAVLPFLEKLRKQGKEVLPIGFFDHKLDVSSYAFKGFNKNDLDWLGRPKKEILESYTKEPFDTLICIYQKACLPIEYVASLSKAHFRVGPYTENPHCYDLIIDTTKNNSVQHFLKEVDFYLNKINNKEHETKSV